MIPQKLYPHLPERSYGEHVMQIAQKLIDTGLTKSHQYRLDHWELKRIQAQNQVKEEDKKYYREYMAELDTEKIILESQL